MEGSTKSIIPREPTSSTSIENSDSPDSPAITFASITPKASDETLATSTPIATETYSAANPPTTRQSGSSQAERKKKGSITAVAPLHSAQHSPLSPQLPLAGYTGPHAVHPGGCPPGAQPNLSREEPTAPMAPSSPTPKAEPEQLDEQQAPKSAAPEPADSGPLYFLGYPSTYPIPYQRTPPPAPSAHDPGVVGPSTSGSSTPATPAIAHMPTRLSSIPSKSLDGSEDLHSPRASTSNAPNPVIRHLATRDRQVKRNISYGEAGPSSRPSKKARNESEGRSSKKPRGGRAQGSINYREEDVTCLLDLTEKFLPIKRRGWKEVHSEYTLWAKTNKRQLREMKALKTKFLFLAHYKKPIDDLKNPEPIKRAKQIDEAIKKKIADGGFEGEGDADDDSEPSSNDSAGGRSDDDDEHGQSQPSLYSPPKPPFASVPPPTYYLPPHPPQHSPRIPSTPGSQPSISLPLPQLQFAHDVHARRDSERDETVRHLMTLNNQLTEKDREIRRLQEDLWASEREKNRLLRESEQERHEALRERDRLHSRLELMRVMMAGGTGMVGAVGLGMGVGIMQSMGFTDAQGVRFPSEAVSAGRGDLAQGTSTSSETNINPPEAPSSPPLSIPATTSFEIGIPQGEGEPIRKFTVSIAPSKPPASSEQSERVI